MLSIIEERVSSFGGGNCASCRESLGFKFDRPAANEDGLNTGSAAGGIGGGGGPPGAAGGAPGTTNAGAVGA